ncbi:hypothetical protein FACS1894191_6790 [Clostridia bacterium]|nr:hypothetical protein FACS1894191_6790 [Clostridia bacterium]
MANSVFRKVSLDRLSSPEQLDQKLNVVSQKGWISLSALAVLLSAAIVWGVFGKVPQKVNGSGLLLYGDGIVNIVSATNGQITDISVREGESIKKGQIIARIAQPELIDKIENVQNNIVAVESISPETLEFNTELLDYETYSSFAQLAGEIRLAKVQMSSGENEIAKSLQDIENAKATGNQQVKILEGQIALLETQIEEYAKLAEYEKKIALENAEARDRQAYEQAKRQREADERQREADERIEYELDNTAPGGIYYTDASGNYYRRSFEAADQLLVSDQTGRQYTILTNKIDDYPVFCMDASGNEVVNLNSGYFLPNYYESAAGNAYGDVSATKNTKIIYDLTGGMYIDRTGAEFRRISGGSSYSPDLPSGNYSYDTGPSAESQLKKRPDYDANLTSMKSQLVGYKLQLEAAKLQAKQADSALTSYLRNGQLQTGERLASLEEQFSAMKTIKTIQLNLELEDLYKQLNQTGAITAVTDGMVLNLVCERNDIVQTGTSLCNIVRQTKAAENTTVVMYVPITEGKRIAAGMEVNVSPSTVKREEHGYIIGHVLTVSDYAVTQESMQTTLRNDQLVRAFANDGAVVEVRVELLRNSSTDSGYQWSTPKGAPVPIDAGTVCAGEVLVSSQRPIEMVMPFIRGLFT